MKPTIDMTRRKSPVTIDAVLRNQHRCLMRTGQRDARIRMRTEQMLEFYSLLQNQLGDPREHERVTWNALEIYVPRSRS